MNPPLPSSPRLAQIFCLLLGCCLLAGHARGADAPQIVSPPPLIDLSFGHEIQNAIDRGLASLLASQNTNGWWSTQDHVAPTALVLTAFMGEPTRRFRTNPPAALTKGYGFILGAVKPDGSIYRTSLINYNTSRWPRRTTPPMTESCAVPGPLWSAPRWISMNQGRWIPRTTEESDTATSTPTPT